MYCSHCDSPDIRKLSLIYEGGVTYVDTRSNSAGAGGGIGGFGAGGAHTHTTGTHTTALAAKAAPPSKYPTFLPVIGAVISVFLIGLNFAWVLGVLACAGLTYVCIRYNREKWPQLHARWDASYMCNRCGTIAPPRRGEPIVITSDKSPELSTPPQTSLGSS